MEIHSRDPSTLEAAIEATRRLEHTLAAFLDTRHGVADGRESLAAAEAAYAAGRLGRARELLEATAAGRPTAEHAARVHQLHGWIDLSEGKSLHAHERLTTEAAALGGAHAALAADLYADAGLAAAIGGEPERARSAARRARELAAAGSPSQASVDLRAGMTLLLAGDARVGERLVRGALANAEEDDLVRGVFRGHVPALYWTERYDVAAAVLDRLIEHGRRSRDRLLPGWIDTRAAIDFRLGRWNAAEARAAEARRLAQAQGQTMQVASCLTTLARISAARGRVTECRGRLDEAAALTAAGGDVLFGWMRSAAGLLELGIGDVDGAVDALEPLVASEVGRTTIDPAIAQATSDLIEAYVRGGRVSDARRLCEDLEGRALESGRSWAAAVLHRCRGLLASPADVDEEFVEALRRHRRTPTPFELARTELCYGERLRRARRRRDATTYLRSALGAFVQLGAVPWAERARRELAAARGRRRAEAHGGQVRLTPHELRVAALVERGLRNREIAATLFVSERTVEYHLTNIYAKLDVRSRTQLARLLGPVDERALELADAT